jgi:uncharacterized protein (DUF433 family)
MTPITLEPLEVPLKQDESGTLRVSGTRLTFDVFMAAVRQGASPYEMTHSYDVLTVADVHHVLAYYLRNQEMLDRYLVDRSAKAQQMEDEWSASFDRAAYKRKLLERWAAQREDNAARPG